MRTILASLCLFLLAQPVAADQEANMRAFTEAVERELGETVVLDDGTCDAWQCTGKMGAIGVRAAGGILELEPDLAADPLAYVSACVIALSTLHGEMSDGYAAGIVVRGFEKAAVMNKSRETYGRVIFDVHLAGYDNLLACAVIKS